ncbi:MAG TPA: phosphoadenylyl-sulfate reductase [Candidatus Binatia bacterium]|jgi:phosphoadenosine phosphosulfate reductase
MDMTSLNTLESKRTKVIPDFDRASPEIVLEWALDKFSPDVALACSFQAEESVLIDMMSRICGTDFRIFTLDTGRLNQETYDCMDAIRERYGVSIEVYFPDALNVQEMVRTRGLNLFYNSIEERKLCCAVRKVEPLNRALKGLAAWLTGLRREQALTRAGVRKVELDREHGNIVKINPLVDWSHGDMWNYIYAHNVPFNRLHRQGYPSIGCAPCTRAVQPGEDSRAGRWWWENPDTKECGLHV